MAALSLGERVSRARALISGSETGEGSFPSQGFPHFTHESLGILHHQSVRNAQQLDPCGSEIILFRRVLPHLAGLRVNATVKFDRQAMFEAVEIHYPVLEAALAPEFCTHLSAAQEMPRRSFRLGLVVPEFTNALGCDAHGGSKAGLGEWDESLLQAGSDPSPVLLRLMKSPAAGHPLPSGEGALS